MTSSYVANIGYFSPVIAHQMKTVLPLTVSILFWLVSCNSPSGKKESDHSLEFTTARENFFQDLKSKEVISDLVPGLPNFDSTLLHDGGVYVKYAGNEIKAAANLGIYIADLNYCIILNKKEHARAFFDAAIELSAAIQAQRQTLSFLSERYKENLEKNDSLRTVVNQLLSASTLRLEGLQQERLAGITMAGYQLENLHLALGVLNKMPQELSTEQLHSREILTEYVFTQSSRWEIIYNFIRANSDPLDPDRNPDYPFFDHALRELITTYKGLSMQKPDFKELNEKVELIRSRLTQ